MEIVYLLHIKDARKLEGLLLSEKTRKEAIAEWQEWERDYVPKDGLEGKTVLDVGAGEGETTHFFFSKGARRVIAIEANSAKLEKLIGNVRRKGWVVTIEGRSFEVSDLRNFEYDFAKIDIEGGESALLSLDSFDKPMVLEIHGRELYNAFARRFPTLKIRRRRWYSEHWIARTA